MSLLRVDAEALRREVKHVREAFGGKTGQELAVALGFEVGNGDHHNTFAVSDCLVYNPTKGEDGVWCCAQKGSHPYGLIAHVWHATLDEALVDAINRGC